MSSPLEPEVHRKKRDTIDLNTAKHRVTNWHEVVGPLFNNDKLAMPRGFYIPIDDIIALADKHRVKGARAYLTMLGTTPPYHDCLRVVIVPVGKDGKDRLQHRDEETGEDVSSIYDFSSPCPSTCDETSDLYNGMP